MAPTAYLELKETAKYPQMFCDLSTTTKTHTLSNYSDLERHFFAFLIQINFL